MLWDHTLEGTYLSSDVLNNYSYFFSAYTTPIDMILAVVPLSVFWKLQMGQQAKLGLCLMMGLTLLPAVVTIIKATYLHLFTDPGNPPRCLYSRSLNFMLTSYSLFRCTISNVGIVSILWQCMNLPTPLTTTQCRTKCSYYSCMRAHSSSLLPHHLQEQQRIL